MTSATTVETRTGSEQYVTVRATGESGHVERRFVVDDVDATRIAWLQQWTADAYAKEYGQEAVALGVVTRLYARGRGQLAHGIEGVTFAFPLGAAPWKHVSVTGGSE